MDKLEKIERLRERAGVSYEEARDALDAAGDDLLDAIVLLEKQGKVKQPKQESYSTQYEEQKQYLRVVDKVEEQKQSAPTLGKSLHKLFHVLADFIMHTSFHVSRRGKPVLTVPSWVLVIALLIFWKPLIPIGIILLIFGFRYSFESDGTADTDPANKILDKAGNIADEIHSGLKK